MQIINSLTDHHALIVLGDSSTSLLQCVGGLPPSLHSLAVEAQHTCIQAGKCIALKAVDDTSHLPAWRPEVLRAVATFSHLQKVSLHSAWCAPDGIPDDDETDMMMQDSVTAMLTALGSSLQHLDFHGGMHTAAAVGLSQSFSGLTELSSIRISTGGRPRRLCPMQQMEEDPSVSPALFCSVVEGMAQLPSLRSLQLDGYAFLRLRDDLDNINLNDQQLGFIAQFCTGIAQLTGLTCLSLKKLVVPKYHTYIDGQVQPALASVKVTHCFQEALKPLTLLETLHLDITLRDIAPVMESVACMTALTRLVLHATCQHFFAFEEMCWREPVLSKLRELRELDMEGYCLVGDHATAVASLPYLSKLRLVVGNIRGEFALSDDFWPVLGRDLSRMSSLQSLNVVGAGMDAFVHGAAGSLVENGTRVAGVLPELRSLAFEVCHIYSSDCAKHVAACLMSLTALTSLHLEIRPATGNAEAGMPDAAKKIAGAIRGMPCLRKLYIHALALGPEGNRAFIDSVVGRFGRDWEMQGDVELKLYGGV